MANPLDDAARALLAHALALPGVKGGRTGEGGPVPETPFVEVGDGVSELEPVSAGAGAIYHASLGFYVLFYVPYTGADPEAEKATLRELVWGFYQAVKADYALGGVARYARVRRWDIDLTAREKRRLWYAAIEVEVQLEA